MAAAQASNLVRTGYAVRDAVALGLRNRRRARGRGMPRVVWRCWSLSTTG